MIPWIQCKPYKNLNDFCPDLSMGKGQSLKKKKWIENTKYPYGKE